ncbi:MAG: hypothetical protein WA432_04245 [Candidatus Babeliaceae bacterium]
MNKKAFYWFSFIVMNCAIEVRAMSVKHKAIMSDNKEVELPFAAKKFKTIKNIMQDISSDEKMVPLPAISSSDLQKTLACLHEDGTVNVAYCNNLSDLQLAEVSQTNEYLGHTKLRQAIIKRANKRYGSLAGINHFVTKFLPQNQPNIVDLYPYPVQQEISQHVIQSIDLLNTFPWRHKQDIMCPKDRNICGMSVQGNTVICGVDSDIGMWDLSKGIMLKTLKGHTEYVTQTILTGNMVISGSEDKTIKVWDLKKSISVQTLQGHNGVIKTIALDKNILVSGGEEGINEEIGIWDLNEGIRLKMFKELGCSGMFKVVLDEQRLFSGSDLFITLWDLRTGEPIKDFAGHEKRGLLDLVVKGNTMIAGGGDETLKIWDLRTDTCIKILQLDNTNCICSLALEGNVFVAGCDGGIGIGDLQLGTNIRMFHCTQGPWGIEEIALQENTLISLTYDEDEEEGVKDGVIQEWKLDVPEDFKKESKKLSYPQAAVLSYKLSHNEALSKEARAVYDTINPKILK